MTEATEHALEQAERIVQYAKYSDRFMVVEGDSAAERRAFVKLIGQKLPRQVRPVVLRPDDADPIEQLGRLLQLSAGIETTGQLITAATSALDGQERLLIVLEHADQWLASQAADALLDLITQAHDLARERILFLLVGASGLCEQVETAQPLAGLVADLHCAHLLGTTQPSPATATAVTANTPAAESTATTPQAATPPRADDDTPRPSTASRPIWASPTLLIAAVISVAVVTIGVFALLGRSDDPTADAVRTVTSTDEAGDRTSRSADKRPEETAAKDHEGGEETELDEPTGDAETDVETEPTAGKDRADTDEPARDETEDDGRDSFAAVDHGQPPHIPLPDESRPSDPQESDESDAGTETSDEKRHDRPAKDEAAERSDEAEGAEQDDRSATPVEPEARGSAPATPPVDVDNAWFRDRPRARAVIQIAAFGKLEGAERMIERQATDEQPRDQWHIYTQVIDDKVLYTVTFGDFTSVERAKHAIDSLPAALRELEPYPRSVGAIQDRLVDPAD